MKKFLMTLCLLLVLIPNIVRADKQEKEKINVYVFYGDGCPHCHKAFEFFEDINDEYGKYFNLVKYETWYSHRNNKMMANVANALKTDTENLGVPYIIIGEKTFLGYSESYNEDIKKAIVDAYNDDDYIDKVKPVINLMNKDLKNTILMAGVTCIILLGIVGVNIGLRKKFIKSN